MSIVTYKPYTKTSLLPLEEVDHEDTIGGLPIEIWLHILSMLTTHEQMCMAKVNDVMRSVVRYLPVKNYDQCSLCPNLFLYFSIRVHSCQKKPSLMCEPRRDHFCNDNFLGGRVNNKNIDTILEQLRINNSNAPYCEPQQYDSDAYIVTKLEYGNPCYYFRGYVSL